MKPLSAFHMKEIQLLLYLMFLNHSCKLNYQWDLIFRPARNHDIHRMELSRFGQSQHSS